MNSEPSRRQMLLMSALTVAAFAPVAKALGAAAATTTVDAGAVSEYAKDGVYDQFAAQGFFIIRKSGKIVAQSSFCTHKRGKLAATPDGFFCKLHNSSFAQDGSVTRPPARSDLARYAVSTNEDKHLIVDMGKRIERAQFNSPGAFVEAPAA